MDQKAAAMLIASLSEDVTTNQPSCSLTSLLKQQEIEQCFDPQVRPTQQTFTYQSQAPAPSLDPGGEDTISV